MKSVFETEETTISSLLGHKLHHLDAQVPALWMRPIGTRCACSLFNLSASSLSGVKHGIASKDRVVKITLKNFNLDLLIAYHFHQ